MAVCLSSTLTNIQGKLCTHKQPTITFNKLENLQVFISSKFHLATWKCCQTTTKGHRPHQRDTPPYWFRLPPWESVNKPMNFNHAIMVTNLINHSRAESARFAIQGCPTLTLCILPLFTTIFIPMAILLVKFLLQWPATYTWYIALGMQSPHAPKSLFSFQFGCS